MRFDDSLATVLSADMSTPFGARLAWRQLVDLAGRGRAPSSAAVVEQLRTLREAVPADVRAATARALAYARPDVDLVAFFTEDDLAIAAPVVRTAQLAASDWLDLLPGLTPVLRSVLRSRRDLPDEVVRALEGFGATDFALPSPGVATAQPAQEPGPSAASVSEMSRTRSAEAAMGKIAHEVSDGSDAVARVEPSSEPTPDGFAISDLVQRIEAFRRRREDVTGPDRFIAQKGSAPDRFVFETDAAGIVIGVEGVNRGALVGLSIAHAGAQGAARLDGVAPGAFRRRSRFESARLEVGGASDAAGSWRMSGVPCFDPATGRFTGFRGTVRRPRVDESVARPQAEAPSADSLRQLVHELRTPTNAIAGFAELIESELLGPVSDPYRARAASIRARAADLLAAIEDLDTASRIEMRALELAPNSVELQPLIQRLVSDLAPLALLRDVQVIVNADEGARAFADHRAAERLIGRLFATLIAAGSPGETIRTSIYANPSSVEIAIDRPRALADLDTEALLSIDGAEDAPAGVPLLGTGFALRVARNLAAELGGALEFGPKRFTLRLPVPAGRSVGHATTP